MSSWRHPSFPLAPAIDTGEAHTGPGEKGKQRIHPVEKGQEEVEWTSLRKRGLYHCTLLMSETKPTILAFKAVPNDVKPSSNTENDYEQLQT